MFGSKSGLKLSAVSGAVAAAGKADAHVRSGFLRSLGAAVIAVAFLGALMACGCSSSGSGGAASEDPSAGSSSTVPQSPFHVASLYAMDPQDIGPYLESQGYAFISEDDFFAATNMTRDEVFSWDSDLYSSSASSNEATVMFCGVWWPQLVSDMMSNPDAYDVLSTKDLLESAEYEDGYAAYVYFLKEGHDDPDHIGEALEKYGPTYMVLDRMDAADLAAGQKPASAVVAMYDLDHYGQWLTADGENSYKKARAKVLELTGLSEPQAACAYADANGAVTAYAWGLCDVGGTECIYAVVNQGHSQALVTIRSADDLMAQAADQYGADSLESLIEALAAQQDQVRGSMQGWEKLE